MEEKIDILENIGLTNQESRVYLALLKLHEAQTGMLCKETNIASSNIYPILDALMKKGLISYRIQNNIKIFQPSPPEALEEIFKEKQLTIKKQEEDIFALIKRLRNETPEKEMHSNYRYFEGIRGIKSMWYEINSQIPKLHKNKPIKIYTASKSAYESLVGFYDEHHKIRVKHNISEQLIFPEEEKSLAIKRKKQNAEIRFLNLQNEAEWGVIGETFFMQYITEKVPRTFLIDDEKFAKTFEQVFNQLWTIAKK